MGELSNAGWNENPKKCGGRKFTSTVTASFMEDSLKEPWKQEKVAFQVAGSAGGLQLFGKLTGSDANKMTKTTDRVKKSRKLPHVSDCIMCKFNDKNTLVNKTNQRPLTEQMTEEGLCQNHQHMDIDWGARRHFVPSFQAPCAHPMPFSTDDQQAQFLAPFLLHLDSAIKAWDSLGDTEFFAKNMPVPVATNKKAKRTGTHSCLQSEKSKTTSSSVRCSADESDACSV